MDTTTVFIALIAGSFGFAYLLYGKKRERRVMMWSGVILLVYPYLISNHALLILIGTVLILLPFFIRT